MSVLSLVATMHLVYVTRPRHVKVIEEHGLVRDKNPGMWLKTTNPAHYRGWQKGDCTKVGSVDATYLKIWDTLDDIGKDAVIEFDWSLLDDVPSWHFNTVENSGFFIDDVSPLSDERGKTMNSLETIRRYYEPKKIATRFQTAKRLISEGELVIPGYDIPKDYIKQIIQPGYANHY